MLKAIVAGATLTKLIAGAAAAAAVGGGVVLAAHSTTPPPADPGNSSVAAVQTTTDHPAMNLVPAATTRSQDGKQTDKARLAEDTTTTDDAESTATATHEPNAAQIAGLCNAWQAHVAHPSDHGKWMNATAFRELASVATGELTQTTESTTSTDDEMRDAVTAYCDKLAASPTTVTGAGPNAAATTHPTRPAMPTQATVHPTRPAMPTQATVHATRPTMPTQATVHPTRPAMPTQATAHPAPPTRTTER